MPELYLLGIIGLLLVVLGSMRFFKSGNKEFRPKLSLRERTEMEKFLEKQAKEQEAAAKAKEESGLPEMVKEEKKAEIKNWEPNTKKAKIIFPADDIKNEISRFSAYLDVNNHKVQHSIRNGVQNYLSQDFKTALEEFSLAVELNSQEPTGYYCRGLTKLKLKNYESAISDFTESIKLNYKEPNPLYYRAKAYYDLKDLDNAILNFKSYITAESGFAEAYYHLGICYKQKEKHTEAIGAFSRALEKEPKFELAYFERGLLKHKVNDKEGGCTDLKKALEMGHLQAYDYVNDLCREKNWE